MREVLEEVGLVIDKSALRFVGELVQGNNHVYFYTVPLTAKVELPNNDEMVDCRWFDVDNQDLYIRHMLPGNERPMSEVARSLRDPALFAPFYIDMSGNAELMEATKNIYERSD